MSRRKPRLRLRLRLRLRTAHALTLTSTKAGLMGTAILTTAATAILTPVQAEDHRHHTKKLSSSQKNGSKEPKTSSLLRRGWRGCGQSSATNGSHLLHLVLTGAEAATLIAATLIAAKQACKEVGKPHNWRWCSRRLLCKEKLQTNKYFFNYDYSVVIHCCLLNEP
nr:PREDICTED: uncharacterized protein LOC109036819 isoform X1 [Bemisia tabaci]